MLTTLKALKHEQDHKGKEKPKTNQTYTKTVSPPASPGKHVQLSIKMDKVF